MVSATDIGPTKGRPPDPLWERGIVASREHGVKPTGFRQFPSVSHQNTAMRSVDFPVKRKKARTASFKAFHPLLTSFPAPHPQAAVLSAPPERPGACLHSNTAG